MHLRPAFPHKGVGVCWRLLEVLDQVAQDKSGAPAAACFAVDIGPPSFGHNIYKQRAAPSHINTVS